MSDDWLDREAVEQCLVHPSDIVSTGQTSYAAEIGPPAPRSYASAELRPRSDSRSHSSMRLRFAVQSSPMPKARDPDR